MKAPSGNRDALRYYLTFAPPNDEVAEDIGYWPEGIADDCVGLGNPQMSASSKAKWNGDVSLRRKEQRQFINAMLENGFPVIELPYPDPTRMREMGITYDIEFLRDHCVIRKDGTVLLFPMGTPHRQPECEFIRTIYNSMGLRVTGMHYQHEGGNIVRLFRPDGSVWAFSGTSKRTVPRAVQRGFEFLNSDTRSGEFNANTSIGVRLGQALHVDCIFKATSAVVKGREQVTFLVYPDGLSRGSQRRMEQAAKVLRAEIIEIDQMDCAAMATNGVVNNGVLINPVKLNNHDDQGRLEARLKRVVITPSTQTTQVGGAFHCLTQEVLVKTPFDPDRLNARLLATKLFSGGEEVKIHNNYE